MLYCGNASSAARLGSGESVSIHTASFADKTFQYGLLVRRVPATTSAVSGVRSLKVTPLRRRNCQRWLPGSACHEIASAGCKSPCSSKLTKVSNRIRDTLLVANQSAWLDFAGSREGGAARRGTWSVPP